MVKFLLARENLRVFLYLKQ